MVGAAVVGDVVLKVRVVVDAEVVVASLMQRREDVLHDAGVYDVQSASDAHGDPVLYMTSPGLRNLNSLCMRTVLSFSLVMAHSTENECSVMPQVDNIFSKFFFHNTADWEM